MILEYTLALQTEISLTVQNLTKRYGRRTIIDSAGFTLLRGETVAITGPLGSGKSTLLKIILSCLASDAGQVRLFPQRPRSGYTVGYQPERLTLPPHISPLYFLNVCANSSGFSGENRREEIGTTLDVIDIGEKARKPCSQLTWLEQRLVALAQAALGGPDLLVLDEPTAGLGGQGAMAVVDAISRLKVNGQTVIIATHPTNILESLGPRWYTLANGKLAESPGPMLPPPPGLTTGATVCVHLESIPDTVAATLSQLGWTTGPASHTLMMENPSAQQERELLTAILDFELRITRWERQPAANQPGLEEP